MAWPIRGFRLAPGTVAGTNALLTAVSNNAPHAADFLLLNCAHVNRTTAADGSTPLHVASAAGHEMCVRVLLRHSADHTIENGAGKLPADVAADDSSDDSSDRGPGSGVHAGR